MVSTRTILVKNKGNVTRNFTYEHSGELVKHPVLWRCDALQVLLRSSCLEERGEKPGQLTRQIIERGRAKTHRKQR